MRIMKRKKRDFTTRNEGRNREKREGIKIHGNKYLYETIIKKITKITK